MKFTRLILLPCAASALALHAQNLPEVASPEAAAAAAGGLEGARDLVAKLGGDVNIRSTWRRRSR
jgi:hypothetical protein